MARGLRVPHRHQAIPPALVNAAVDALAPFGVTHVDMPLTAEKLWRAMRTP
jgi:carbon-monoxide dehydrogenase large subunit